MKLYLRRDIDTGKSTIGRLYAEDEFLCYTLENTWLNNKPRVSCIPPGCYTLSTKTYGRFYNIMKKPIPILGGTGSRSEILIHWGNYPKDTLGCILLGDSKGIDFVGSSRATWLKHYNIIAISNSIEIINDIKQ